MSLHRDWEQITPRLANAARGTRVGDYAYFGSVLAGTEPFIDTNGGKLPSFLGNRRARLERPAALHTSTMFVELSKQPPHEWDAAWPGVEQAAAVSSWCSQGTHLLRDVLEMDRLCQAELHTAATALAIERYRLAHGMWPTTLADVTGDRFLSSIPADPYDGRPLRYLVGPDGVVVYSVGPDRRDDGGKRPPGARNHHGNFSNADVGFRLLNPDRRGRPAD
jgi:hypothetical protein